MTRTCLHCALARALQSEADALAAQGLAVTFTRSDPVWLPTSGTRLYRGVRRLLQAARAASTGPGVKLAVVDLPGKSHVEVIATVTTATGTRVFSCAFARHASGTLAGGFAEGTAGRSA
jgi:hypothetical protein